MALLSKGSKPIIGLNIGTKHIKAVEVRNSRGTLELLGAGVRPTPEGVISNGIIVDPGLLGSEVRELLEEAGIKGKRTVSSVAGQQSLVVRIIEVPRMTTAELKETMKWEIERHIPFPAEDVVMDFQPLDVAGPEEGEAESETMEVLLAVAQEELINAHVATLEAAGLVPQAIDIEPLAMARTLAVLDENGDGAEQTVAIINMGARVTDISVIRGLDLMFTRSVPLGGENLTSAIAEQLGLQPEEAERAKHDVGSAILTATAAGGVDSMEEMVAAEGDEEESPFAAFEFDLSEADAGAEGESAELATDSETTGDVPEFDLSLDALATDDGTATAADTETTGEVAAFDLGLDTVEPTEEAGLDTEPGLLGGLDLSLESDEVEVAAEEPVLAAEQPDAPAVLEADAFDLNLDAITPTEEEPAAEASLSLEAGADLPAAEEEPPALRLDLDTEEALAEEPETDGIQLDLGADADEAAPSLELDLATGAGDTEPAEPLSLELDMGEAAEPEAPAAPVEESGAFELDLGPEPEGVPEDSPGAFELDMGDLTAPQSEGAAGGGFELDFGGADLATEADSEPETGADAFELAPAAVETEIDSESDDSDMFSFDLEEPSSEDDGPGELGEPDTEEVLSTEEETGGGLMDLDELADLAELGTAGGEVTEESVYAAISPVINELLTETRRSLEYYTSRYQGATIDKVLLVGGSAKLRGLAEVLGGELGLNVEIANPFEYVEIGPKCDLTPEYVQELSPTLCVGLGLAIREMVED